MINNPQKILIRGVNWIGDAVLSIPAIHAVRKAFPHAHISLLVKPWVADIFSTSNDIDEIIIYEDSYKGLKGKLRLAKILKGRKFNTAVLLQNAFDAALIAWLAKVPEILDPSGVRRLSTRERAHRKEREFLLKVLVTWIRTI